MPLGKRLRLVAEQNARQRSRVAVLGGLPSAAHGTSLPLTNGAARDRADRFQAVEEQVEVDHPCIGLPTGRRPRDGGVVERGREIEHSCQVVAGADVVAGEDVQTSKPAQKDVFRAPASETAQARQFGHDVVVAQALETLEVQASAYDVAGQLDDRRGLAKAKAEIAKRLRRETREIVRAREGVE